MFKDSYQPDGRSCFEIGIDSITTKIRIYFQTRSDSQIRVSVPTDNRDNMVSLNLQKWILDFN
jgi:hypothetical protein